MSAQWLKRLDSPWGVGQAEVINTRPMGVPFHLWERSMEGAPLSCWFAVWMLSIDVRLPARARGGCFQLLFLLLLACASGRVKRFFYVFSPVIDWAHVLAARARVVVL